MGNKNAFACFDKNIKEKFFVMNMILFVLGDMKHIFFPPLPFFK